MAGVSQVLKDFGSEYLTSFADRMTLPQKKVLRAVMACRDERLGVIRYRCDDCGVEQTVPRSCCNRHCSACQWNQQKQWLQKQTHLLLPCHYFMITFTLPEGLRDVSIRNPEVVYAALMKAAAWAIKTCARNVRFVDASETGFVSVLHTWGRDLSYHPHAHVLVPGGGIGADGRWKESRRSVFVPEQVLEAAFRGKLQRLLEATELAPKIDSTVWNGRFVVNSKAVGSGEHALKYLAPYVSRGCVADWRVTACDSFCCAEGGSNLHTAQLTLQVKRSGTKKYRPMRLSVVEFIRRWLLHVCPSGLHRVRHYGFLNAHSRRSPEELRVLIAAALGEVHYLAEDTTPEPSASPCLQCPACGGKMLSLGSEVRLPDASLAESNGMHTNERAPP